jgi:fructosamine-3-kinase
VAVLAEIAAGIAGQTGIELDPDSGEPAGGGSIHRSLVVAAVDGERYFLKCNSAGAFPVFSAEQEGLLALRAAAEIRVPAVIGSGRTGAHSWLMLEYLDLRGDKPGAGSRLGAQLARLHRHTGTHFGFASDNFIGATPQPNSPTSDWLTFLRDRRLGYQLRLAAENGGGVELRNRGAALLRRLPALLAGHRPEPALLHGDLWGGNWGALPDGTPVLFDPAVYYGDREADIAMTELFGGFGPEFRRGYAAEWPLPAGYEPRRDLYNLYHVLNHLNLFGGGYLRQAMALMDRLLE